MKSFPLMKEIEPSGNHGCSVTFRPIRDLPLHIPAYPSLRGGESGCPHHVVGRRGEEGREGPGKAHLSQGIAPHSTNEHRVPTDHSEKNVASHGRAKGSGSCDWEPVGGGQCLEEGGAEIWALVVALCLWGSHGALQEGRQDIRPLLQPQGVPPASLEPGMARVAELVHSCTPSRCSLTGLGGHLISLPLPGRRCEGSSWLTAGHFSRWDSFAGLCPRRGPRAQDLTLPSSRGGRLPSAGTPASSPHAQQDCPAVSQQPPSSPPLRQEDSR